LDLLHSWQDKTIWTVLYLSLLVIEPWRELFKTKNWLNLTKKSQVELISTFMGCWIAAFVLPLDWQKEYQV
jgi:hypothetical protein